MSATPCSTARIASGAAAPLASPESAGGSGVHVGKGEAAASGRGTASGEPEEGKSTASSSATAEGSVVGTAVGVAVGTAVGVAVGVAVGSGVGLGGTGVSVGAGVQNKVLEAMAVGLPVVSTSLGAEGLPVEDGSNILIGNDPRTFADHVIKLLKDNALRKKIGETGLKLVRDKFPYETGVRILEAVLKEVADKKRRHIVSDYGEIP